YKNAPDRDPLGPDLGSARTLRGGSWGYSARPVRCASRSRGNPDSRSGSSGFRVVWSPGF
ncbi:MAG: SUMF1/EgtB/PvdO family nonheme iron enzyme, partial [Caldilineaceae bacterium]|nr:SUMF1/EgtB/PvdO family nonheme iron enzyme [Caldilineaceae bacterium]